MDKLKMFFDDFTFKARVMPVVVLLVPFSILAIFEGIVNSSWRELSIWFPICIIVLTFSNKVARNLGKAYESKMYTKLGAMPTTIVLRFSDNTFDEITKQRYHKKINCFEGLNLPLDISNESSNDDEQYRSAINILRNYANENRKSEPRVYQELKEYNFWRNLYGSKWIALGLYTLFLVREFIISPFDFRQLLVSPYPDYITAIVLIISIGLVLFCVNKTAVKAKAFDYARTLVEVCERIPVSQKQESAQHIRTISFEDADVLG